MKTLKDFSKLENAIGIKFKNKKLLQQAFVHRSCLNENPGLKMDHNERLEFLGDAVLELVVTKNLFNAYPNPEGELTTWRASLVNSKILSEISSKLGFNDYLMLSRGESQDSGRARQLILANTFEALIGSIYLDQGFNVAEGFIKNNLLSELPKIIKEKLYIDPKSHFQEKAQEKFGITPSYKILEEEGPDHRKSFVVGIYLNDEMIAKGRGPSKQAAQVNAAEKALKKKNWE